ncbi:hypothetical protein Q3C01_01080 [Bradyrhizobium sp. UFLA05-109]
MTTELDVLEELADQMSFSFGANGGGHKGRRGGLWSVSPALERSKVARAPKNESTTTASPPRAQRRAGRSELANPLANVPTAGETIATVTSYPELVEAFRAIKDRLGLSNKFVDDACDYADGITDKLLGPSHTKTINALSFSMFCAVFAVRFEMKVDLEAVRKMEARWEGRETRKVAPPDSVLSKKLLDKARPIILRELAEAGCRCGQVDASGALLPIVPDGRLSPTSTPESDDSDEPEDPRECPPQA